MHLLLDTHIAVWAITDRAKLSPRAVDLLIDPVHRCFVSVASIWEIAIKNGLTRSAHADALLPAEVALNGFTDAGFSILAISPAHACAVEALPPHHGDPFDRLIVAQAKLEPMRLVTHDARLAPYSDLVFLV
jgi:PIN domain nuclease of toxin-antitoxin system